MAETQSFFSNPVNRTKAIVYGVLGFLGLSVLWKFQEQLVTFADNMVHLGIIGGSAIFLWWFWANWGWVIIEKVSTSITSMFANLDPVSILSAFVKDMKKKQEEVVEALKEMMTVKNANESKLREKQKEMTDIQNKYEVAQENNSEELTIQELAERYNRRQKSVEAIENRLNIANNAIATMTEIRNMIGYHIRNAEDEKNMLAEDNDMALSMITATTAAKSVLGENSKLDIKMAAVKVIQDRTARAKAEVDDLMESTRAARSDQSLEKMADRKEGIALMEKARSKATIAGQAAKQGSARMLTPGEVNTNLSSSTGSEPAWAKRLKGNK